MTRYIILVIIAAMLFDISISNDVDTNHIDDNSSVFAPEFRLLKYHEVWDLVLKRVSDEGKLKELARVLTKLDKAELEYKRKKQSGDPTYHAEAEQSIVSMLPDVLKRHGVLDELEEWKPKETHFKDIRLQNLWKKLVAEGELNSMEMKELHAEFHVMQGRLNEFVSLTRRIENYKERVNNETSNDLSDIDVSNSVEDDDDIESDSEEVVGAKQLARMKKTMENKFQNIDEDVFLLTEKVKQRISDTKRDDIFTDSRVKELWEKAQGLFIKKDLEMFESELNHFQNRISKLQHWKKMVETLRPQLDESGFDRELKEEYRFAKDRVIELTRVVKKYHATLIDRVYSHFKTEL